MSDARIVCRCTVDGSHSESFKRAMAALAEHADATQMKGNTDDGTELTACHLMRGGVPSQQQWSTEKAEIVLVFLARELNLRRPCAPDTAQVMRFGLTNLEFIGTERYTQEGAGGIVTGALQLPIDVGRRRVVLRRVEEYRARLQEIKFLGGIDITCEASVDLDPPMALADVVDLMDDLCLLLSLAKGCQVQWVYYEVCPRDDEAHGSYHRDAVTKPFTPLPLIPLLPSEDLKSFVELTFDKFREQKDPWELSKAIAAYTDAKLKQDYLALRGLKLAVLMEFLKGCYSRGKDLQPPRISLLQALVRLRADAIKGALRSKLCGPRRYSFKEVLHRMSDELGLDVSDDLTRFVRNRDKLVHRARFRYADGTEEYFFMMTLVGKFLLAILGYDGWYLDWTRPPGWVGHTEMRIRLELQKREGPEPD